MGPLSDDRLALLRSVLAQKGQRVAAPAGIPRRSDATRAPLSSAQERLYFLELYEPGTALYNDGIAVWIEGPLDLQHVARAVLAVQARHESLRTTFHLAGEGPEQHIAAPSLDALPFRACELHTSGAARDAGRALAEEEVARPFDLEQAPPWRVLLARLGEEHWLLVVTMHHIVSDGASMGLFFDDLSAAYAGRELAPLALQLGDYSSWERTSADPRRSAADLDHWRRQLSGEPRAVVWREGGGHPKGRGGQLALELAADTPERVAALARASNATPNHVYLAAWLALLAAASSTKNPLTGVASSLRTRRELEPLLGFFVQSLPLRARLADDPSFGVALGRVRAAALTASEHAAVPFGELARALDGDGSGRFLQAFFSHMRDAIRPPSFAGTRTTWEFVDAGAARFDLSLVLHESAGCLTGFLEYDGGVFPAQKAHGLAEQYARLLHSALADPGASLSELARRSAPARAQRVLAFPTGPRRAAGSGT